MADEPIEFRTFFEGIRDRENSHISFKTFAFCEYFLRLGRCWFYIARIQHRRFYVTCQLWWLGGLGGLRSQMKEFHKLITFTIPCRFRCHNWASWNGCTEERLSAALSCEKWHCRSSRPRGITITNKESERYGVLHCPSTALCRLMSGVWRWLMYIILLLWQMRMYQTSHVTSHVINYLPRSRLGAEFPWLWVVAAATKVIPKMETLAAANVSIFGFTCLW